MAVVQAGENIELWRDLTQNVTLSVGTILNRTGSVYYRGKGKVHIRKFVCVVDPNTNQLVLRPTVDGVTLTLTQFELLKYNLPVIESRVDMMKTDVTTPRMEYELDGTHSVILKRHLGHIIVEFTSKIADRLVPELKVKRAVNLRVGEWERFMACADDVYLDLQRICATANQSSVAENQTTTAKIRLTMPPPPQPREGDYEDEENPIAVIATGHAATPATSASVTQRAGLVQQAPVVSTVLQSAAPSAGMPSIAQLNQPLNTQVQAGPSQLPTVTTLVQSSTPPTALQPITQVNQALGAQVLPGPAQPQILSPRPATLGVSPAQNSTNASATSTTATLSMIQEAATAAQALLYPNAVASQSAQNLYQLAIQPAIQPAQTVSIKRKAPEEEAPAPPKAKKQRKPRGKKAKAAAEAAAAAAAVAEAENASTESATSEIPPPASISLNPPTGPSAALGAPPAVEISTAPTTELFGTIDFSDM